MTLGTAELEIGPEGARLTTHPAALAPLLLGRTAAEVAERLPRLFNLCRSAQSQAAHLALGLPPPEDDVTAEVFRDHQAKVFVTLRQAFGLTPMPPRAFTPLPTNLAELPGWMSADSPEAELARIIAERFPPGLAITPPLVFPLGQKALSDVPHENSAAGRQATDLRLAAIEESRGRGPLWRYLGLLVDAEAAENGQLPVPVVGDDTAVVQAARGAYALRLTQKGGVVTAIERRTPTDHQLAPGGPLEQAMATLPADKTGLAPLVLALHDPCIPVTVARAAMPDLPS